MGADASQHARVWFDWNQDGDFEDAGEAAGTTNGSVGANGTAVMAITVPSNALVGTTRMRVRGGNDAAITATQSCGVSSSGFGEAEDYNVTIAPCVQGTFTTHPASSTITCGGNASFTVAASGSLPVYSWQFRTGPTAIWQALPNGGVVSGATTATLTLTNVPTTWNGYEIRAMFSGACTGINPSNAATLTVNPIQTVVSPASANICSGSLQRLTITNFASTSAPVTASFTSTDIPKPIPDNNTTGVTSNITVSGLPAGAATVGLAVRFTIPNHTWPGDLVIVLRTPNGQILNLSNEISGTGYGPGQGMVNTVISSVGVNALSSGIAAGTTFTGVFRADRGTGAGAGPASMVPTTANWADIYGPSNGVYTIGLRDKYAQDFGTLTAWSLDVTYVVPSYGEGVWTAAPAIAGTMFLDAAGTIPYNGTREDTIFVRPTENTTYSVFFNSTISPCTSAPASVRVNVGLPITTLAVPATAAACVGSGFTITGSHAAIPSTNAAAIYQWQQSTDGGVNWTSISGATGLTLTVPSTTAAMNGMRYRLLSQSGGCPVAVSNTSVLTVNPLPSVTLSAPVTSLVPGRTTTINGTSSPAAAAWSWSLNGASIAGTAATRVVNIDGLGSYQATVRDVNGCINRSNLLAITGEASDKLFIYPNPTAGAFQVRYYHAGDANEKRIISVYNPMGQLVAVKTFDLTYSSAPYLRMDVDMSGAARGTYVVKVAHEYSGKIVSGLVLVQ
jgi:subtilisin-like proprotein convertase family protein